MNAFITVMGRDKVGIIANTASYLATKNINIEDISQTVLGDTFTMIMAVSVPDDLQFDVLSKDLSAEGKKLGVEISIRHEDIFNAMHRI